ncbi:MAG: type I 3-dehydroquinate dehydratase [Candidatus Aenigmatarchaeota archaeon]
MRTCACLYGKDFAALLEQFKTAKAAGADMVEVRLDLTENQDSVDQLTFFTLPVIVSNRKIREGGLSKDNDERIINLLRAMKFATGYVDIEISSLKADLKQIQDFAKSNGIKVIASYHNYKLTPDFADLKKMFSDASKFADTLKIFSAVRNEDDMKSIKKLFEFAEGKKTRLSVTTLGKKIVPNKNNHIVYAKLGGVEYPSPMSHFPTIPEAKAMIEKAMTL